MMAYNDPSFPHPITLGVIVPLGNVAAFRAELRAALDGAQVQEVRRILAGDDGLLAKLTDAAGLVQTARGLSTHLTDEEWDFLKTANQLLTPATRALVEFSQLKSASKPLNPDFWTWANSLGFFLFEPVA